ncbi:fumarylacetoacetase [Comamonadaceae bacterium G21597-S1]|nr:fumarylacetoacetase [Comamonadaceae bacterium G21597-S1]
MQRNHTHDPAAASWLPTANMAGGDFPIQNLPFAVFRRAGSDEAFRGGVAIGDQVVDLAALAASTGLAGLAREAAQQCARETLNEFLAMGPKAWQALRHAVFALLEQDATPDMVSIARGCLVPMDTVEYALPNRIGDYTDFYTSLDHARNVGALIRPDDPVSPNFRWMPIAYHGRASSIGVSGQQFHRPMGQAMPPGATAPVYGACARLDYELELGIHVGVGNTQGQPVALAQAEDHIFGICMLNDWSARDIQFWEMNPLGPFLGKNFATTISPWIITMEALLPYRQAWTRAAGEPQPLAYLDAEGNRQHGALDIQLEVSLQTAQRLEAGDAPARLSRTSFRHQYWTVAQMLTHHTMGGCNLLPGDLLGTGTISGPSPDQAGAIIELTRGGTQPLTLEGGSGSPEQRRFLDDGDSVIFRGWCEAPGAARIGFGECRGTVLPALGS